MEINDKVNALNNALTGKEIPEAKEEKQEEKTSEKKEKKRIVLDSYSKFEGIIETKLHTTHELCAEVNTLFLPTVNGYVGSTIRPVAAGMPVDINNPFILTIYVEDVKQEDLDPKKITLIKKISLGKDADALQKINMLNLMSRSKMYTLTSDAKEVLEEYIRPQPGNKNINWDAITSEVADNSIMGRGTKYFVAIEIDLIRFLKHIYGFKTKNGSYIEYRINNLRPTANYDSYQQAFNIMGFPMVNPVYQALPNFLITIERLDGDLLKEAAMKNGFNIPQQTPSGIPIITGTNENR